MPNPQVKMETTAGSFVLELYPEDAPITVKNFLEYVDDQYFKGTIFHRVIKGFMIQGGGLTADMQNKASNDPIVNEASNGLKNDRGTVAMARTSDPDSASSQFFINHKNNEFLNYSGPSPDKIGYAVFGKVIEGMDVVDKIAETKTASKGYYDDVPVETIEIISVEKIQQD